MQTYTQMAIRELFSTAERIFQSINSGKGGYLALCQRNDAFMQLLQLSMFGTIPYKEDPDYGTKQLKYRAYAEKKCQAIFDLPGAITSGTTPFGIKGAIKVNESLILGFSGLSQDEDEALVIATSVAMEDLFHEENLFYGDGHWITLKEFKRVTVNPLLTKDAIQLAIHGF